MVCNCDDNVPIVSSENSESTAKNFWNIGSSLMQKKLQLSSKALSHLGNATEYSLNFISNNGGDVGSLCKNIIRGQVKKPNKDSENYFSLVGHLDERWDMDSKIKPGDPRYLAQLSVMASKLSYENKICAKNVVEDRWKMKFEDLCDYWNDYLQKHNTQVLMLSEKKAEHNVFVVAFRGTECFVADDWCTDFDISLYHICGFGYVHGGFAKALGLRSNDNGDCIQKEVKQESDKPLAYYQIKKKLIEFLSSTENKEAKYILTGHSLGGALAVLFAAVLAYHEEYWLLGRLEGIYTFGQPRVGDYKFADVVGKKLDEYHVKYLRFVYGNDIVPRVPFDGKTMFFKHFGTCIYFDTTYEGQRVDEQPNKNYFSITEMISMKKDAASELLRSFTIEKEKGADYKEGKLLKLCRAFGLLSPGVVAHGPQDYVNCSRLGSPDLFK